MITPNWDRREVIARVRADIWRYISETARTDEELSLFAGALLQMPAGEIRTLAQLQFILSGPVARLLDEMPLLIRRLTNTTENERETSAERVRGSIRWGETIAARAATGLGHVYVTAPARRAFDTPENRLLVFALDAIRDCGQRTGWHRSTTEGAGTAVASRVAEATRWRQARALADVDTRQLEPKAISRVRAGRSRRVYQTVLAVVELYQRYIARVDRAAIRNAIEHHALVTGRDSVLLELLCTFTIVRAIRELGWKTSRLGLLRPPLVVTANSGSRSLELYYQHSPSPLARDSIYRTTQRIHGVPAGGLIPDLVMHLRHHQLQRWVLVEVKGGEKGGVTQYARAALLDLLAYRRAFDATLSRGPTPYGIGIAWGRDLGPAPGQEILLCSPDKIKEALELVLATV